MDNHGLENALAFAELGHAVFPLHGITRHKDGRPACTCGNYQCDSPGKHPFPRFAPNGLKNATTDADTILRWWRAHDWLNYGVCTEALLAVDVDPRHEGDETLQTLEQEHGEVPPTWRALTGGGGEHIFLEMPAEEIRSSSGKLGPGLDVRGRGGYVVGVGSAHISGRRYVWSVDHHPAETPLAPAPAWIIKALAEPNHKEARPLEYWRGIVKGVPNGHRSESCASLTGKLLFHGIPPDITHELVLCWNLRNSPRENEDKLNHTVRRIIARDLARGK